MEVIYLHYFRLHNQLGRLNEFFKAKKRQKMTAVNGWNKYIKDYREIFGEKKNKLLKSGSKIILLIIIRDIVEYGINCTLDTIKNGDKEKKNIISYG